jgi:hypothetical protein
MVTTLNFFPVLYGLKNPSHQQPNNHKKQKEPTQNKLNLTQQPIPR